MRLFRRCSITREYEIKEYLYGMARPDLRHIAVPAQL
jgi:hypothetical protein